jgi:GntR family transcriptional regulator, histidine utilization repressor
VRGESVITKMTAIKNDKPRRRAHRQSNAPTVRSARAMPLFEQVKQYVLSKVADGTLVDGSRVPSEHELANALGMSRVTVNRALHELSEQGLVLRVQGSGTFIKIPPPKSSLIEIRNISDEVAFRGHRHRSQLEALEPVHADAKLAEFFQVRRGARIFHSVVIHFENDTPIQLEERFVNPRFAPKYLQQDFTRQTTSGYLHSISYVTEVEHTVYAAKPGPWTCELLNIEANEPCLCLLRETWVGRLPTSKNILTHPGSRYSLASRYLVAEK